MSRPTIPMQGTWGRLTIIGRGKPTLDCYGYPTNPGAWWDCLCSCNTRVTRRGVELRDGKTVKSCGCYNRDTAKQRWAARKDLSA